MVVTEKAAAQAFPFVGALGSAAVNYAFIEHFQDVARASRFADLSESTAGMLYAFNTNALLLTSEV